MSLLLCTVLLCTPQEPPTGAIEIASAMAKRNQEEAWCDPKLAERCDEAAQRGLAWLAAQQTPAGCWIGLIGHKMMDDYEVLPNAELPATQRSKGHGHIGVTALCGMAFLAGGYLPDRGRYREVVGNLHHYVASHALESGLLTDAGTRMYSHAFATLFLAEIHGLAGTAEGKQALEGAVNLIVDSQNEYGGWRYNPFDREIDLSVTVCQVQALRAARNIGIRVPPETIERALDYVRRSRVPNGRNRGLFYYKIHGRGAFTKPTEYAINAAGLTALSSAGVYDQDLADPVLEFLGKEYGSLADYYPSHFYYWYGNYYAAQAFYQQGGSRCRTYFARLAADLLGAQASDGRWRNDVGPGDEFATAVACILLQMPKQYLPIFQR